MSAVEMSFMHEPLKDERRHKAVLDEENEEKIRVMAKGCISTLQVCVPHLSRSCCF